MNKKPRTPEDKQTRYFLFCRLRKHFHEFPSATVIWSDPMSVSPHGAKRTPSEMLVKLIGAYVIAGKPLKPLVEKLHPEPETVNWEKIERYIYGHKTLDKYDKGKLRRGRYIDGMLDKLRLIATEIRGGSTRTGPFDELSRKELSTAWEITEMEKDGLTRDEIYEELKDEGYTRDDVNRLSQLRPKQPD